MSCRNGTDATIRFTATITSCTATAIRTIRRALVGPSGSGASESDLEEEGQEDYDGRHESDGEFGVADPLEDRDDPKSEEHDPQGSRDDDPDPPLVDGGIGRALAVERGQQPCEARQGEPQATDRHEVAL